MQKIRRDVTLGQNIRNYRRRAGLTQEQVVARLQLLGCSTSRSIYSQMENGTYNIRVCELSALCEILRVDYNGLFSGTGASVDFSERNGGG